MNVFSSLAATFALALTLAACGSKSPAEGTTPASAISCADAAKSLSATMRAQGAEMSEEELAAIEGEVAGACSDDAWAQSVVDCFAGAQSGEATQACSQQLTQEQQQGLAARMMPSRDEPMNDDDGGGEEEEGDGEMEGDGMGDGEMGDDEE